MTRSSRPVAHPVRVLALGCCLVLAGCVSPIGQFGQPAESTDRATAGDGAIGDALTRQVNVSLSNWADVGYTVEVRLVAGPVERVTVSYENGTERTVTVDEEYYLPGRLRNATGVSVQGRVLDVREFRLDPETHEHARHPDLPSNVTVVYTASPTTGTGITGWNVLRCEDDDTVHEVYVNLLSTRSVSVTSNCRG